jgi:hypothetical protein
MRDADARFARWAIRLTLLGTLVMLGILPLFYETDSKSLATRLMRAVNPMAAMLPWLTQNMRLNAFNVRLYDCLVVAAMALQCCIVGCAIDLIRWMRRNRRSSV